MKTLIAGAILACLLLALIASAQITPVRTVGGIGVRSFETCRLGRLAAPVPLNAMDGEATDRTNAEGGAMLRLPGAK